MPDMRSDSLCQLLDRRTNSVTDVRHPSVHIWTPASVCVLTPLPAEFNQVDKGSEIFDLIGQEMSCGV